MTPVGLREGGEKSVTPTLILPRWGNGRGRRRETCVRASRLTFPCPWSIIAI